MDSLTVTEQLCESLIALPTGAGVNTGDIGEIGMILIDAYENALDVRQALRTKCTTRTAA